MGGTWVLPTHAAAALGIETWALDLPTCGLGIEADALWIDPRFIEIRRSRDAVARQMERRRHNVSPDREPPRYRDLNRERERSKLRKKRKAMRASMIEVV
jgi:hypothetical protein